MTHGSLFSGIGGFDLASDWMGWENKFHCEWNEFGQQILNYYWPQAKSYGDITTTDFTIWNGKIDILTGGFPCQPYSQAGKRRGKEDERHLWPEMLRAIKEIEPRWIVGENVYGIVNWNGGMVFNEVQTQLENEGYTVQPYVLPAAGVNAPHQRYRVWFLAYANRKECFGRRCTSEQEWEKSRQQRAEVEWTTSRYGKKQTTTNASKPRLEGSEKTGQRQKHSRPERPCREWDAPNSESKRHESPTDSRKGVDTPEGPEVYGGVRYARAEAWRNFPTQSPVCNGNDGFSSELDGITFPKWRNESIKGGGNAIVPQVAFQIFKAIEKYDSKNRSRAGKVPGSEKVSEKP